MGGLRAADVDARCVLKNARDMGPPSQGWADPPELAALRSELQSRTTFASGNGVPQPMGTALLWDEKVGAPLNPVGRTGLAAAVGCSASGVPTTPPTQSSRVSIRRRASFRWWRFAQGHRPVGHPRRYGRSRGERVRHGQA